TTAKRIADKVYCLDLEPVADERMNPCPWRKEICYQDSIVRQYNTALLGICERMKVKVIPSYEAWRKENWKTLLHDGSHPNSKGHELTFKTVRRFLEEEKVLKD
ncbi:MAG: SGNH/GDSL hydrolase family protein, partial [Candidatus Woesearchaeota archaeon]|nr:SGNH/GDSL hydrolase family protein [Candidatus Woesearchaeota archaeon]